ncbi:MAG: SoxR reducing system RseC family protein [Oscillospiraceae bacterium]|nr:SoxR reducing system RseC family protein [Oscillospiraceae bacterium]
MKNTAYVKEINGGKAVLKVRRECACQNKYNCNAQCFALQNEVIEVTVDNNIGAKTGDFVEVEGKTSAIMTYAAVVFILPVFITLLLFFITYAVTKNQITPFIVSGIGFVLSIVFLYYFLNNIVKGRNDFAITKIL